MYRRLYLVTALLVLMVLALAACAAPVAVPEAGEEAATLAEAAGEEGETILVVALGADATGLDPESVMNDKVWLCHGTHLRRADQVQ